MKSVAVLSMLFSVFLGFVTVARLLVETKWAFILLTLYSVGALFILAMVYVMATGGIEASGGYVKPKLQLRPNDREWIVKNAYKNTPTYQKYT
jgi:hypothetical protein